MGGRLVPRITPDGRPKAATVPLGTTPHLLLRDDLQGAYPIVDGIPILLVPEMLTREDRPRSIALDDAKYAEAYEEMKFYDEAAAQEEREIVESKSFGGLQPVLEASQEERSSFPEPKRVWIDAVYDCAAEWEAFAHLAPLRGKRMLQLGGKGGHSVRFLLGGAAEAWSLTPMLGEARCARALGEVLGFGDRHRCIVAVAEELPLAEDSFDGFYSGGCLHHMLVATVLLEAARVLRSNGKFAAIDPWRAPLYAIGTKILGKREPSVYCRPLTSSRIEPLHEIFVNSRVIQHGTLLRYPLLALNKFGVSCTLSTAWRLNQIDDALCSLIPGLRRMGSSVAILATK